jgi:hypothetical protein
MNSSTQSGTWREQISSSPPDSAAGPAPYVFWTVLLIAGLAGLLIRVEVGRKTLIDFDEWQHVFMAASARWSDLFFELRTNSHPPLFFVLLSAIVKLGNVALYRSISIAAGAGSIIVVGLISKRILHSPAIQLLCATAFALSADAISISVQIRSYQLAVFLTLLAFLSWLDMFPRIDGRIRVRPCVTFAICSSLAVFCHYSAVFFMAACLAVSFLLAAISPRLRDRWIAAMRNRSVWLAATALAIPCAVFAVEFVVHVRIQLMQGYIAEFYRGGTPGEKTGAFVLRNSRNFFNLFSPVELNGPTEFLAVMVLLFAGATWVLLKRRRTQPAPVETSVGPVLFAIVIVLELLVASLARKYPFGGLLRHQYVAGPFILIAAFVSLDALVAFVSPILRLTIPALLLGAVVANLIVELPKLIIYPGMVILDDEFKAWRSAFPDTHALYLDHWSVIGYFIHTSDRPRRFVRSIPDNAWIDQYHVPEVTSGGSDIFYDKTRDLLDLRDPGVYQSIASCLRVSGVRELSVFYFSPDNSPLTRTYDNPDKLVMQKAAEQGLITTRVVVRETSLFAGFKLNRPSNER